MINTVETIPLFKHSELAANEPRPHILIRPKTADEEFRRISRYAHKLSWYIELGYPIDFPDHPVFQNLFLPGADLSVLGLPETVDLFCNEIYKPDAYEEKIQEVYTDLPVINQAFARFLKLQSLWGFRVFPQYNITITRYGTGGSYDPDRGEIVLSVLNGHKSKRTVIHEGVHIGIDDNVVNKHALTHSEKERLVDLICMTYFGDLLPKYWQQPRTDRRIDPYVTLETLLNLPESIENYVRDFPRT